jgi:hypothetical protein
MDRWLEDANPEKRARSKEIQARLATCRDRINALTQEHVRELAKFDEVTYRF